jgi:aminoglycoside phosphotransferase family enzyme
VRERVETHMSEVLLTARHAFKRKKPVQLAYVDYRTAALREASCAKELRLGKRLAAGVYENVVHVASEPFIVMRRLPADRMLPAMLARGQATEDHAVALADRLVDFYAHAPRASWTGAAYVHHLRALVRADAAELVARGGPRGPAGHVLAAIERRSRDLASRARYVVDAHGDLRPEHVCLETPPVVIDPLEIDDLRLLDPASELAFFSLECGRLGAAWFGERVLVRYSERSGDVPPAVVLEVYTAQHALARALIALRHIDDGRDAQGWRARAADYLARAS